MGYQLGVDLGTTYTAAAVHRDGRVEIVTLGNRAASIPSAVFLREDEQILTGDAANRRGVTEPDRVAREFKRRIGDPTPLLLGGTPYSAETLLGKLLRWTVDAVAELEGGRPDHITVCHPANWGPYKKDLLAQALRISELDDVASTITEPEAAAIYYASNARVEPGSVIAVYDLGGGTFDAAVLQKTDAGWEILGTPEGIERLGGVDFDEAVFAHVRRSLEGQLEQLDPKEPAAMAGMARLRQDTIEAKEALSNDSDVSIPVMLPNISTEVRLTRTEFEAMIRPTLQETISALRRALASANVEPADISAVLLVGGSSRIPLVTQLVGGELGRPVAVDAHPKHSIALGAAIQASRGATATAVTPAPETVDLRPGVETEEPAAGSPFPPPPPPPLDTPALTPNDDASASSAPPPPPPPVGSDAGAGAPTPARSASSPSKKRGAPLPLIGAVAGLVALIVVGILVLGGGDDGPGESATATTSGDGASTSPDTEGDDTPTTDKSAGGGGSGSEGDPEGTAARITDVRLEADRYLIDLEAFDFVPNVNDAGSFHVHLFWDTLPTVNAGGNGPTPGAWLLWGTDLGPLTDITKDDDFFLLAKKPPGAGGICVVVADHDHNVADVDNDGKTDLDTGNCVDLPG